MSMKDAVESVIKLETFETLEQFTIFMERIGYNDIALFNKVVSLMIKEVDSIMGCRWYSYNPSWSKPFKNDYRVAYYFIIKNNLENKTPEEIVTLAKLYFAKELDEK